MWQDRISIDNKVMVGKPVIKGTRLTVEHIVSMLADDVSIEELLQEYKGLERADILACLAYANEG
jgi:uncharacterized protein (DUF433 family)